MTALVIGASGFLGAHVVAALLADDRRVRALIRPTSDTRGLDGLDVDIVYGDVFDTDSIRTALVGVDTVYYCVVDARAWLRDAAPLWRTNVDGLRSVLDIVADADLDRFVFTSSAATIGRPTASTIGRPTAGLATEDDGPNWQRTAGEYVRSRVAAEELAFEYHRDRGVPVVAMCVANTYGAGDYLPTPHGRFVSLAACGKLPFSIGGVSADVVGVDDAARALVLAGERGRPGERYIVAERHLTATEINECACAAVDVPAPRRTVPRQLLAVGGAVSEVVARIRGGEPMLTRESVRLMHVLPATDSSKTRTELGWTPRPTTESIADAARFFVTQRRARRPERADQDR